MKPRNWIPLKLRESGVTALEPAEGVPDWMRQSIWVWIRGQFAVSNLYGHESFNVDLGLETARTLRKALNFTNDDLGAGIGVLLACFSEDDDVLELVDFLAARPSSEAHIRPLNDLLAQSGSVWTVASYGGVRGLSRRLEAETENEFSQVDQSSVAGLHLAKARVLAFGREPNPSASYSESVKALEAALTWIEPTNQKRSTLSDILRRIEKEGWNFVGTKNHFGPNKHALAGLVGLVWNGQTDRHSTNPTEIVAISQQNAEIAFSVALLIVQAARNQLLEKVESAD